MISSILNKMDRNRRSLSSLRAGMTMQKYNAQLRDFDMSSGEVKYIAGQGSNANVRVDWTKPARETLAVMNGQYTLCRPRLNQCYQGSTKSGSTSGKTSGILGFSLSMSGSQVKNQFNVELAGEGTLYDGGPHVWMLKLTPRGGAGYKFAEVWVSDDGMPVQTRVTERNGDSTLVRLTNIQRNARVSTDEIKLEVPAGAKIVKG
ncbi:MAG TPA: outer membrane lipoprotein carrier protein LolA [Pyrinomonadaceae bacterium]|nr:outer membrane lipoprotein carrier protein LolA [Pyrinomonadaceae bacterium]